MMRTQEVTQKKIEEVLFLLENELTRARNGESTVDSAVQLEKMKLGFNSMLESVKNGRFPSNSDAPVFSYWHNVIDTWPFKSELRSKVVEAELDYEKL